MKFATGLALMASVAGWVTAAAQEATPSISVYSFPAPPAGFNAVLATDEERARYGLPRRPNPLARNPMAYQTWLRAMSAAQTYVAPQVMATRRRHARVLGLRASNSAGTFSSQNWAGQTILNNTVSYGPNSYGEVLAQWVVSAVQQPPGTCGGTDLSAIWVGIDGIGGSNDVLQGGTEADANCSAGNTTQVFYPWFEWYPDYEYQITNFPVVAGAPFLVVVQATSATTATVVYVNIKSRGYTVAGVSAPAGTTLKGNSAEWVIERPASEPGNTLGTMADFGMILMTSEIAFLSSEIGTNIYDIPGAPGGGRTAYNITMLDSVGNTLAYPRPQGTSAQEVDAAGPTIQ